MNIVLWILQVILALLFLWGGIFKLVKRHWTRWPRCWCVCDFAKVHQRLRGPWGLGLLRLRPN